MERLRRSICRFIHCTSWLRCLLSFCKPWPTSLEIPTSETRRGEVAGGQRSCAEMLYMYICIHRETLTQRVGNHVNRVKCQIVYAVYMCKATCFSHSYCGGSTTNGMWLGPRWLLTTQCLHLRKEPGFYRLGKVGCFLIYSL